MELLYIIGSTMSVILWTPILITFFRAWKSRRNPVSLSICSAIMLIMWTSVGGIWVATHKIDDHVLIFATVALSVIVAINAHIAFYWSKKRFVDARSERQ